MNADGITVRPAVPEDLPVIMRFVRDLAAYEKLAHECVATEAQIGAALFGTSPRAHALIAEEDDHPVGLALWFYTFSTFTGRSSMYLEDLFVDPAFRGRGVARRLFAALGRRAVAEGCERLEWAVLDWNEMALRFYRSLGARPLDEWTLQRLSGPALAALAAS
jgi:GNAT superfamily N-acetyltransferase